MQALGGRIAGNDKIGVVPEPLQATIPNISMDIILGAQGSRRNAMFHAAASTSPITTMRRENPGVAKNSRIAKRYAMPASVNEAMKYGPPLSPKLREQTVSATHNVMPRKYTLHSGVTFTVLSCRSAIVPPRVPTLSATAPCVAPSPGPDATRQPSGSGRQLHQYRRRDLLNLRKARDLVRATGVSPAHCWCPIRRL